jgi:ParB-like chromosome segregation protein Spo0J
MGGYEMSRGERADGDRRNLLLATFAAAMEVFRSLIAAAHDWLGRRHSSARKIELNLDGDTLDLKGVSEQERDRLISEFSRRHLKAEEQARREAEEQARREAEEQARREAPEMARQQAKRAEREAPEAGVRQAFAASGQPPPAPLPPPVVYDDLVRSAFAELVRPGRLLFNPPGRMQLGHTERVEVRLARTLKLDKELLERLRGQGEPQLEEILTAPLMAVTLEGDGFKIKAYSDEEQSVTQDEITTWEFDIRALQRGQQRLVLCVSLRIPVPGQPSEHKSIPVREAVIDVQVRAPALVGHFVSDNWQWFIGTAIAIAAVVVAVVAAA